MSTLFLFIGFIAGGTAILLFFIQKSPVGFQDETGFHFGSFDGCATRQGITNVPSGRLEDRSSTQFLDELFRPLFPRLPQLIKGFGLAALFIGLVVLPRTTNNVKQLAMHDSPEIKTGVPGEDSPAMEIDSKAEAGPVLMASARVQHSKFGQKLCARFSQIE